MAQPNYKIPLKKRLANGGNIDDAIDQGGVAVASAFGPWWGALAKAGSAASKKVAGDRMNESKNVIANELDPFKHLKGIAGGFKDPKRFIETVPLVGPFAAGKRMKREAMAEKEQEERDANRVGAERTIAYDNARMQQFSQIPLAKGGKMRGGKSVISGGDLKPIGKNAVRVKAQDPGTTDSVELPGAFVDHNEVIKGNRVFSDDMNVAPGKSVADEAENAIRAEDSDRLNKLFQIQESNKSNAMNGLEQIKNTGGGQGGRRAGTEKKFVPKSKTLQKNKIIPLTKQVPMKSDKTKFMVKTTAMKRGSY